MKAQILKIEQNATKEGQGGKTYTGVAVTYQPPEYQGKAKDPVTRFLFGNSDVAKQVINSGLMANDWVEITFDNTKWKNPESFTKIEAPAAKKAGGGGYQAQPKDEDTQTRIARAVALKGAIDIVNGLITGGGYTAANVKKREYIVNEILETAKAFEPYLCLNDTSEDDVYKDLYDNPEEVEQETYDD